MVCAGDTEQRAAPITRTLGGRGNPTRTRIKAGLQMFAFALPLVCPRSAVAVEQVVARQRHGDSNPGRTQGHLPHLGRQHMVDGTDTGTPDTGTLGSNDPRTSQTAMRNNIGLLLRPGICTFSRFAPDSRLPPTPVLRHQRYVI